MAMKTSIFTLLLPTLLPCFMAQVGLPYNFPQNSNIPGISAFPFGGPPSSSAGQQIPSYPSGPFQYPSGFFQRNQFPSNPSPNAGNRQPVPTMNIYSIFDMMQKNLRPENAFRVPPNYKLTGEGYGQKCHPTRGPKCRGFLMVCKCKTCLSGKPCYHQCC